MIVERKGHIHITTRSKGSLYHGFPQDFWRYEVDDIGRIFTDFEIIVLKKDNLTPRVFFKARQLENYVPADLSDISLYSMVLGRRVRDIPSVKNMPLARAITTMRDHLGVRMMKVLDVGSYIFQNGDVNVDLWKVPVKKPEADFVQCDLNYGLPFVDGCFQNVFCYHVLEHILDPYFLLDELLRC